MAYFGGGFSPEAWEIEYGERVSRSIAELSEKRKLLIMLSVGLVAAIEISNRLSINVLLPDLQGNVAGSSDDVSWVLILYNLGFLCSMALSSWMTRVVGARRYLLSSLAVYAAGALGCFFSGHNLTLLLVSRVVMGFGGGAFLVRTVILARLMFPPGKTRIFALTCLYAEFTFFEVLYPTTMGWISDSIHWNYAFLLDFPFLAIGAYMIWKYVPWGYLYLRSEKSYVDLWGAGLLIAALSSLQIALSRGQRDEWFDSRFIVIALTVAFICFLVFLWWDWRPENPAPILHLRTIWKYFPLRASLSVILVVGAILGAALFVLPQYLRHVQDYSATQTGGFVSAYTAGLGIGLAVFLRYFVPRFGGTKAVVFGALLMFACCVNFLYIWTPTTPTIVLLPSVFFQGFALGPMLLGAAVIATGQASTSDLSDISTTFFFVRQLGNTFGVTAATVLFDYRASMHSSRLEDVANRLNPTVQETLSQYSSIIARNGGAGSNPTLGALQIFQANVITQSQLLSYIDIYFGLAVLSVFVLVLLIVARPKSAPSVSQFFHFW
jgi:MFS transporter, DHA2 family, multidrug resistance protein